jgi:hypothetical protein
MLTTGSYPVDGEERNTIYYLTSCRTVKVKLRWAAWRAISGWVYYRVSQPNRARYTPFKESLQNATRWNTTVVTLAYTNYPLLHTVRRIASGLGRSKRKQQCWGMWHDGQTWHRLPLRRHYSFGSRKLAAATRRQVIWRRHATRVEGNS